MKQRIILDLHDKKTLVVGDLHGDLEQLESSFRYFDNHDVEQIVFNGDIIDRGEQMLECIILIIIRQLRDPDHVFIIRGNHEVQNINEFYGFKQKCVQKLGIDTYYEFNYVFTQIPLCAKLGNWCFIVHGGIPIEPIFFHLMRIELKPSDPLDHQSYGQLLWNDPREKVKSYAKSRRGEGIFYFGEEIVDQFMKLHEIQLIVRAHEAFEEGYKWIFGRKILSIFSSNKGPYKGIHPKFALLNQKNAKVVSSLDWEIYDDFTL